MMVSIQPWCAVAIGVTPADLSFVHSVTRSATVSGGFSPRAAKIALL